VLGTPQLHEPRAGPGQGPRSSHRHLQHGVVLYELATGQRPFLGATFSEIVNNIVHTQPAAIARLQLQRSAELSVSRSSVCRNRPIAAIRRLGSLMVDLRNLAMGTRTVRSQRSGSGVRGQESGVGASNQLMAL